MGAELPRSGSRLPRDEGSHSLGDDDTNYFHSVAQPPRMIQPARQPMKLQCNILLAPKQIQISLCTIDIIYINGNSLSREANSFQYMDISYTHTSHVQDLQNWFKELTFIRLVP